MKSLIILKGLVKQQKLDWVKREKLENYILDIEILKKMYSCPDLIYPGREELSKSYLDLVYQEFIKVLCIRLSKGCLVVVDPEENVSCSVIENLALIYGYTVFYVINNIPQDYINHSKKYDIPYYSPKTKKELNKEVNNFLNLQTEDKNLIKTYKDVLDYWEKSDYIYNLAPNDRVLHVSDLHSNFNLYKLLPNLSNYSLVIFHGDYIDGPEIGGSKKLIDKVIKKKNAQNLLWIEGNHELRLRKLLGCIMLKSDKYNFIYDIIFKSIPSDFLQTTATEFNNLNCDDARNYLQKLNNILKPVIILNHNNTTYYCTHAGLKFQEQLDPRYIGSVIYGDKNVSINTVDSIFSGQKNNNWSIHAHCKYLDEWNPEKYDRVINLDPIDEYEIIWGEQFNGSWKIKKERLI